MKEFIKYNCHVMEVREIGSKTPTTLISEYNSQDTPNYIFEGIPCTAISVEYSQGRTGIITKIVRTDSIQSTQT